VKVEKMAKNGQMVQNSQPLSPGNECVACAPGAPRELSLGRLISFWCEPSVNLCVAVEPRCAIRSLSTVIINNYASCLPVNYEQNLPSTYPKNF